jgi:Fe-S oxidoreductase
MAIFDDIVTSGRAISQILTSGFTCKNGNHGPSLHSQSIDILDVKMKDAKSTKATVIVTTNPGCLLQMQLGIQREGMSGTVRAVHLVELLADFVGL